MNNNDMEIRINFKKLGEKYNFNVIENNDCIILTALNTDGKQVDWIKYNMNTDNVSYTGNTDNCNIWLYDTRKDMTPDKIIQFVDDLNNVFKFEDDNSKFLIKELIDPEDWQEIANINDASEDERYMIE